MQEGTNTRRKKKTQQSMGDRVIRYGAIAAAVVTIIGLARLLWPDPTPRLAGELADVSIVTRMTLAEFVDRQKLGSKETELRIGSATNETSLSVRLASSVTQESSSPTPRSGPLPPVPPPPRRPSRTSTASCARSRSRSSSRRSKSNSPQGRCRRTADTRTTAR